MSTFIIKEKSTLERRFISQSSLFLKTHMRFRFKGWSIFTTFFLTPGSRVPGLIRLPPSQWLLIPDGNLDFFKIFTNVTTATLPLISTDTDFLVFSFKEKEVSSLLKESGTLFWYYFCGEDRKRHICISESVKQWTIFVT